MNEEKLSGDKVPEKFAEWLLTMGCPPDKVPPVDKLADMCRGHYYMVWRSLMEHVEPKQVIRQKRLQVFNNDVQRCQKKNAFCKPDSSVVVPEELSLWKQQTAQRERVVEAEARVLQAKQELNQLMDKFSSKLSQRNLTRSRVQAAQRRAWLLQQLAEELRNKKYNLSEARSIADSLCSVEDCDDVESKLDKVISRRQNNRPPGSLSVSGAPLANSTVSSNGDLFDTEDQISSLVKCGGALWPQLCERRAALITALQAPTVHDTTDANRITPQWVLSHTAALHCSLALNALKSKLHATHTQKRLAAAVLQLNDYISGPSCELLVVRCERAGAEARLHALRALYDEMTSRTGAFEAPGGSAGNKQAAKQIAVIDKAIESKHEELRRLISSLAITERKIQTVRECLITVFGSFHSDAAYTESDRFGGQKSLPQESVSTLRRFYEERRERHRNNVNLSMDLDTSENCSYDAAENANPTFVDELKIYLKKFKLEKNRKLVLDSGEKIWIFETLQSSIDRLHSSWQREDVTCSLVCPSVSLSRNMLRLIQLVEKKEWMEGQLKMLEGSRREDKDIDMSLEIEEEQRTIDKIKKRLNENIISLQKTTKNVDLLREDLSLWSENEMKKYISCNRTIDGKTFKEYEGLYKESLT
ncbi:hypothetical protein PYW08_009223 [Mythimna loreyi]|uniref:Uncharacterized protein n=1 Tax=Mythimna loreyi TaxID=667449 RepID=A0ACC2QAH6_9NEOP|nr:hypothetical protein PYW08_009223 [Mythimna loreyi]